MKIALLSAFAALTLMTAVAHAEGGDNMDEPFGLLTNGVVTVVGPASLIPGRTAQLVAPRFAGSSTEVGQAPEPRGSIRLR